MKMQINLSKDKKEIQNEKRKYYIVDANKVYFINDDNNFVYLDSYFDKNNVNKKYRKALFQIIPLKNKTIEFITDLDFDTAFLSNIDSFKNFLKPDIKGNSNLIKVVDQDSIGYQEYEGIIFNTDTKSKHNYNYIIKFLRDIKTNNELEKYIKSISMFIYDGIACTKKRKIINSLNNHIIEMNVSVKSKKLHLF